VSDAFEFHDQAALIERLTNGLVRRPQEVVFLVGAPLSAPIGPGLPGVPGVQGVIDLIRNEFSDDPSQTEELNALLKKTDENQYQAAFYFLQGRRGQQTANEIVRTSVYGALDPRQREKEQNKAIIPSDQMCRFLESNLDAWVLSQGTESLGKLIVGKPQTFGRSILTTNFDPLIEVSIRKSGGTYFRTTLHRDGNLSQTEGIGCHVVHLHGYWFGSDTLHTARQLSQSRPRLKASLRSFLANKLIVTCAYSGWDDTFTEALIEVVLDDTVYPEILWTFYSHDPRPPVRLAERLAPGIDRGRVNLYAGIDCNIFLPELYSRWAKAIDKESSRQPTRLPQVVINPNLQQEIIEPSAEAHFEESALIEGDDEDRPPVVDICVGRDIELAAIRSSTSRVVFLTGFGGQGKSTLAAKYFADCQHPNHTFDVFVWRDCKEERERFENQLISVIEKLSSGRVGGAELSLQEPDAIVESFLSIIQTRRVLLVFDNVDHYVDLEKSRMVGAAGIFIDAFLRSGTPSRVIFTCRPDIDYHDPNALTCRLGGLTFEATTQLFTERRALTRTDEIEDAHILTEGHAFWLDLLAIQVAKRAPNISLTSASTLTLGSRAARQQ
jgi:hypothetical protein